MPSCVVWSCFFLLCEAFQGLLAVFYIRSSDYLSNNILSFGSCLHCFFADRPFDYGPISYHILLLFCYCVCHLYSTAVFN